MTIAADARVAEGENMTTDIRPTSVSTETWIRWAAIDDYSGFEVLDPQGRVGAAQIGEKQFAVSTSFRFADEETLNQYRQRLVDSDIPADQAKRMLDDARTLGKGERTTDLASVPRFMRWFEAPYGRHTLAAVLHDELIQDEPNTGALKSDTLSDSFFRDMMGVAGVKFFKRWLMWAAVAARSRWVARGKRRTSLILWGLLALIGIAAAVAAALAIIADTGTWDRPGLLALVAAVLPFAAGFLWGKQYGAGIVAAAAGIWLIPAAIFVIAGLAIYEASERVASLLSA